MKPVRTVKEILEDKPDAFCIKPEDKLATIAIAAWLNAAIEAKVDPSKIGRAYGHQLEIIKWQQNNPDKVKLPD